MAGAEVISALGAGSGFDTVSIIDALVEAERAPKQAQIDRGIEQSEAKISAYGVVTSALESLKTAFDDLKDTSDYQWFSVNNQSTDEFLVSASVDAEPGSHSVSVSSLASPQSTTSSGFTDTDQSLNGGSPVTLSIESPVGSGLITSIEVAEPTPQGIVDALNAADIGYQAQLFDVGFGAAPYQMVVTGELGAENTFEISTNSLDISFDHDNNLTEADDASFEVDGLTFSRSSNQVTDVIPGVTLSLQSPTGGATRTFNIERDVTVVESSLRNLVAVYNDVQTVFGTLKTPTDDSDEELAGALASDSTFRSIRDQVREMVTGQSSTAAANVGYLADAGISITRSGTLEIDESALSSALTENFSDLVTALSADSENQSAFGDASRGIAGDASKKITDLISSNGPIRALTTNAQDKADDYAIQLEDLDSRMEAIRARYVAQFASMESIVDQMNSTREYLKTQLENLPFTSNNN